MKFLYISLNGTLLIAVIIAIRMIAVNRLPKAAFRVLWLIAAVRLLLPFSVPSPFSLYTWGGGMLDAALEHFAEGEPGEQQAAENPAGENSAFTGDTSGLQGAGNGADAESAVDGAGSRNTFAEGGYSASSPAESRGERSGGMFGALRFLRGVIRAAGGPADRAYYPPKPVMICWLSVAGLLAAFFSAAYTRCRRKFRMSLPADSKLAEKCRDASRNTAFGKRIWKEAVSGRTGGMPAPNRRRMFIKGTPPGRMGRIEIRVSDRIASPLTYGIVRPVILLPRKLAGEEKSVLRYTLEHEYMHIRHFDAANKILLAAVLCLHWFNPFVWVMYILANRDMELHCDESVVRLGTAAAREEYALVLIRMEEVKRIPFSLYSCFSKNAMEERITAIMKAKKKSLFGCTLAFVLIAGTATVFATSAAKEGQPEAGKADHTETAADIKQEICVTPTPALEDGTVPAKSGEPAGDMASSSGGQQEKDLTAISIIYGEPMTQEELQEIIDWLRNGEATHLGEVSQQEFVERVESGRVHSAWMEEDGTFSYAWKREVGIPCIYSFYVLELTESDFRYEPGTAPTGIPGIDLNDETDYYLGALSGNGSYDHLTISYVSGEQIAEPTGCPGTDSCADLNFFR